LAPVATAPVATAPVATLPKVTGGLSVFDLLIDAAPEVSELPPAPEPPPWKSEKPVEEPKAPAPAPAPAVDDTFHNDPLIQAALVKFEGKVLGS
jgi:DNA polymerase III subunit gamma/tau